MPTDPDSARQVLEISKRIRALADISRIYAHDGYDLERAAELLHISNELASITTGLRLKEISALYTTATDYPTPKVDVRGVVLNPAGQILMVQEKADERWSIPGGWADIGKSPAENIVNEIQEECGLEINVGRLLAVYDKRKHLHPPQPFYVYKLIFQCALISPHDQPLQPAFDILNAGWFDVQNLPPLSTDRILKCQIEQLVALALDANAPTLFD